MSPRPLFLMGRVPVLRAARITEQHWKRQKTQPIVAVYFKTMRNEVGLHLHYITVEYLVVEKILSCRPVLLPSSSSISIPQNPPSIGAKMDKYMCTYVPHVWHKCYKKLQLFILCSIQIQDFPYSRYRTVFSTCSVVLFYQNHLCSVQKVCITCCCIPSTTCVLPLIHSV